MNRIKFIDRMSQGKVSRRDMMKGAAAFGVGVLAMPHLAKASESLTVLEWAGYDAPDYYKPYVSKHGGPPAFSIFSGEEEALQKVRGGFAADLMHPCNYSVGRFVEAKLVNPIDTAKLSHWNDLFPALQTAKGVLENGQIVMAPADWGNSSYAYRPDLVEEPYKSGESWSIFTDDKYAGKVAMSNNEVAITIAAMLNGMKPGDAFYVGGDQLAATKPIVEKIIANSRVLWDDPTSMIQMLASGEIVAAYAWNDAAKNLQAQGIPVAYAKPKEGYFTWFCGMTLLNSGKADTAAAHDFVDAWLSPETGKYLIEASGYGHSNTKSFAAADPAAVKAMGITDPMEHMASAHLFPPIPSDTLASQIKFWEELKALKP
jgi:spermidine/putrescine-binding protein